jgi:hypothetical protein
VRYTTIICYRIHSIFTTTKPSLEGSFQPSTPFTHGSHNYTQQVFRHPSFYYMSTFVCVAITSKDKSTARARCRVALDGRPCPGIAVPTTATATTSGSNTYNAYHRSSIGLANGTRSNVVACQATARQRIVTITPPLLLMTPTRQGLLPDMAPQSCTDTTSPTGGFPPWATGMLPASPLLLAVAR